MNNISLNIRTASFFLFFLFNLYTFASAQNTLYAKVTDAFSGAPIVNLDVFAIEMLPSGDTIWRRKSTTDNSGNVTFSLNNLNTGATYFLRAKPFQNNWVSSKTFDSPQTISWQVGTGKIRVIDTTTSPPQAFLGEITIKEKRADSSLKWAFKATPDSKGEIRVDFTPNKTYVAQAKSTLSGAVKTSTEMIGAGVFQFNVGNLPLIVKVKNANNGIPLDQLEVTAIERLPDGSEVTRENRKTNAQGELTFELDGLGSGREYLLKSKPYRTWVQTKIIDTPTSLDWKVGTTKLRVTDTTVSPPVKFSGTVSIWEKQADGTLNWILKTTPDNNGDIFLDLTPNKNYIAQAKSVLSGQWKTSNEFYSTGSYQFSVGNLPLTINVKNSISGKPLKNLAVYAIERLPDGSERWRKKLFTDVQGKVAFELDGLGSNRQYHLKTKPYHNRWIDFTNFNKPKSLSWIVGKQQIQILNGNTNPNIPLPNKEVTIYEALGDGSLSWYAKILTDDQGNIHLDLSEDKQYILKSRSEFSFDWYSKSLSFSNLPQKFVIGNLPLNITLLNANNSQPLVGKDIFAIEITPDGSEKWRKRLVTNAQGTASFELNNLGSGGKYYFRSLPYENWLNSKIFDQPGDVIFPVGSVPVSVWDEDNNQPLAAIEVTAFSISDNNKLIWEKKSFTDINGIAYLDLNDLDNEIPHIVRAKIPSQNNKTYSSKVFRQAGPVNVIVSLSADTKIDLEPPSIQVNNLANNQSISDADWLIEGYADDNKAIEKIDIAIQGASNGLIQGDASYNNKTKKWSYTISGEDIRLGDKLSIGITAYDLSNNLVTLNLQTTVVKNTTPPQITFLTHNNYDQVSSRGFTVMGTAKDDIAIKKVEASFNSLQSLFLSKNLNFRELNYSYKYKQWAMPILADELTEKNYVYLSVRATDSDGQQTIKHMGFIVNPSLTTDSHLLNRITFGITPQLLSAIKTEGTLSYLTEQLNPELIDDSGLKSKLSTASPRSTRELQTHILERMIYSKRQLQEVMTWFWDNHFNTDLNKHRSVKAEFNENNAFRNNALGRFRDLLEISAKSPAMLVYLDSVKNNKKEPNENYAREIMELHTLGVDSGYDHKDIESLAKIFTGWKVKDGAFYFNENQHDFSEQFALGNIIPAGGVEQGELVLDILASHPSTANRICRKLSELFINDIPPENLITFCADIFISTNGNIKEIVGFILQSEEFNNPSQIGSKFKTPLEFITSVNRNLMANYQRSQARIFLTKMGMPLFGNIAPTGWNETASPWLTTNQILQRMNYFNEIIKVNSNDMTIENDLMAYFRENTLYTSEAILGYLNPLLLSSAMSSIEFNLANVELNTPDKFEFDAPDANTRLKKILSQMSAYPGVNLQ